jgi:RP/EB family microtubule-associated protein
LGKIEETCTGAIACQLCDSLYPGKVNMSKVSF